MVTYGDGVLLFAAHITRIRHKGDNFFTYKTRRCSLENFGAFDYIDNQADGAVRHVTILPLYALSLLRSRS